MKFIITLLLISSFSFSKPKTLYKSNDVIWSFDFINANELIVSEREGKLSTFNLKTKKQTVLNTPEIETGGQGGLLDVHYRSINNKNHIYITFSEMVSGTLTTSLARAEFLPPKLKWNIIFRAKVRSDTSRHFGSRLAFIDNHIFMTIGDRGKRKYAQDLSTHQGKILRLTHLGKAAKGNPFENTKNALSEIWSYGHRNPQGIAYDKKNKVLYSTEFGPRGGDELNIIQKGKNYGWPTITYGKEYWGPKIGTTKKEGMEQPLAYWVPSISPSGLVFYNDHLYLANLSSQHIRKVQLKSSKVISQTKLFKKLNSRIRHVKVSPNKKLYFSTDDGSIYFSNF